MITLNLGGDLELSPSQSSPLPPCNVEGVQVYALYRSQFSLINTHHSLHKVCETQIYLYGVISTIWRVYGDPINHVSDFRYLGSMVASGSSDLKRRKSLAWCAFWKLEQLWKSPHISISTKVKLFNTTCVTILLYGCESWVISQDMENKINAFATSCYRVMLNIKRIDHVLNTAVRVHQTPHDFENSCFLICP